MQVAKLRRVRKILLAISTLAFFYIGVALLLKIIGLQNAQDLIQQSGVWAPAFFVVLCAVSLIIAPLSGSSLFVVGGTLFGKETSFALSYLASILGCSINFWIARRFGSQVAGRFIGEGHLGELNQFTQKLRSHQAILYMMPIMLFSQDIVSYAVGLTRIKYRNFLIALIISGAAVVAAYTYLGSSLLETIVQG